MNLQAERLGIGSSSFSMSPFSAKKASPRKSLGETEQTWYSRAKSAVAEYDSLWGRAQQIAGVPYRQDLAKNYHGNPTDATGALYRRNSVAYNISQAESYTPTNYLVFGDSQSQNRVQKLEDWNRGFKTAVKEGESIYGVLEAPITVERTVTVERDVLPSWVVPVVVVGGLVIIGTLLFGSSD